MQPVTPCISVCEMDEARGLCAGCYRTRAEIGAWRLSTPDQQLDILRAIARRLESDDRPDVEHRKARLKHRLVLAGILDEG